MVPWRARRTGYRSTADYWCGCNLWYRPMLLRQFPGRLRRGCSLRAPSKSVNPHQFCRMGPRISREQTRCSTWLCRWQWSAPQARPIVYDLESFRTLANKEDDGSIFFIFGEDRDPMGEE